MLEHEKPFNSTDWRQLEALWEAKFTDAGDFMSKSSVKKLVRLGLVQRTNHGQACTTYEGDRVLATGKVDYWIEQASGYRACAATTRKEESHG